MFLFIPIAGLAQSSFPYQNPDLPTEGLITNILSLMTLDEKNCLLKHFMANSNEDTRYGSFADFEV